MGHVALAVVLAFLFGYALTSLPLLRSGLALAAVVPIALASDTFSIATMEIVDNAIMLAIPGAMEAGPGNVLFWGALSVALVVAGVFAFPVNRWLIARGKGHAAVDETDIHGGPSPRAVGAVAAVAFVFGVAVLTGELLGGVVSALLRLAGFIAIVAVVFGGAAIAGAAIDPDRKTGSASHAARDGDKEAGADHGMARQQTVRGLAVAESGLRVVVDEPELRRGKSETLRFRVVDRGGSMIRDFDVAHEKRMHLILARRDLSGFQHLHPEQAADGSWSTDVRLDAPGSYRLFADFARDGKSMTLAFDLRVDGEADLRPLPGPEPSATSDLGYGVRLDREGPELRFTMTRDGRVVRTEPYLGAGGHLVVLREGDLAFLHVHPSEHDDSVSFATVFPTAGRYRLFLQFKHEGRVHTVAFTQEVQER